MSHFYHRFSWPGNRPRPTSRARDAVRPWLEELEPRNLFAVSFGPTVSPFVDSTPPSSIVFSAVPTNTAPAFQPATGSNFAGQPVLVQASLAQTAPPLPQNQTMSVVSPLVIGPFFTTPAVLEQGNGISTQPTAVLPIPNSPVYSFIPVEVQLLVQLYAPGGYRPLNQLPARATFNLFGGGVGAQAVPPAGGGGRAAPPPESKPPAEEEFLKYTRVLSLGPTRAQPAPAVRVEDVDRTFEMLSASAERAARAEQDHETAVLLPQDDPSAVESSEDHKADPGPVEVPAPTDPLPDLHEAPVVVTVASADLETPAAESGQEAEG